MPKRVCSSEVVLELRRESLSKRIFVSSLIISDNWLMWLRVAQQQEVWRLKRPTSKAASLADTGRYMAVFKQEGMWQSLAFVDVWPSCHNNEYRERMGTEKNKGSVSTSGERWWEYSKLSIICKESKALMSGPHKSSALVFISTCSLFTLDFLFHSNFFCAWVSNMPGKLVSVSLPPFLLPSQLVSLRTHEAVKRHHMHRIKSHISPQISHEWC